MRLDFNILWFENQPEDVATQISEVEEYVGAAGFKPSILIQEHAGDLDALSERQENFHEFDLVVVDWDLGNIAMQGDLVAQRVRMRFGFTDIMFYSGKARADLRRMVHDRNIDGVYCMSRNDLVANLAEHIDEVVKRLSRLEAMRGLAVGAVGQCDHRLKAVVKMLYAGRNDDGRAEADESLIRYVQSGVDAAAKNFGKCTTFDERLDSRAVTSFTLQKLALHMLKGVDGLEDFRETLKSYDQDVIAPRNTLGHALERRGAAGWEVQSSDNPPIGREQFPTLRLNLLRHIENIDLLCGILGVQGPEETS